MTRTKASLLALAATAVTVVTLFLLPFTPRVAVHSEVIGGGTLASTVLLEGMVAYREETPCMAAQAGRVQQVHVRSGQRVKAGELLFTLDTSAQQETLASMAAARHRLESAVLEAGEALPMLESIFSAEGELRAAILAAQVRAPSDGVVGDVYAREGGYVGAMSVLGVVRDARRCVTAAARAEDLTAVQVGAPAVVSSAGGKLLGFAELLSVGQPILDSSAADAARQCVFTMREDAALAETDIGERVTVELLCDASEARALVPLSAIDSNDSLWVIREGKAWRQPVEVGKRSADYAVVDDALCGERVVLQPSLLSLYPGCPVKEAKGE